MVGFVEGHTIITCHSWTKALTNSIITNWQLGIIPEYETTVQVKIDISALHCSYVKMDVTQFICGNEYNVIQYTIADALLILLINSTMIYCRVDYIIMS